jgi:hypothetical protein
MNSALGLATGPWAVCPRPHRRRDARPASFTILTGWCAIGYDPPGWAGLDKLLPPERIGAHAEQIQQIAAARRELQQAIEQAPRADRAKPAPGRSAIRTW